MYCCQISECGLSYQTTELKDLVGKLHEYLKEMYGTYIVNSEDFSERYNSVLEIKKSGRFFIRTNFRSHEGIFCIISEKAS